MTWHPSPEYAERMEARNCHFSRMEVLGWSRGEIALQVIADQALQPAKEQV